MATASGLSDAAMLPAQRADHRRSVTLHALPLPREDDARCACGESVTLRARSEVSRSRGRGVRKTADRGPGLCFRGRVDTQDGEVTMFQ